jgi:hypothetical protein
MDTMDEEIGRLQQELEQQMAKCEAAELKAVEVGWSQNYVVNNYQFVGVQIVFLQS